MYHKACKSSEDLSHEPAGRTRDGRARRERGRPQRQDTMAERGEEEKEGQDDELLGLEAETATESGGTKTHRERWDLAEDW